MLINKYILNESIIKDPVWDISSMIINIKTTGFSTNYSSIYMIGILYYDSHISSYVIEQWFREKDNDSYEMLYEFNKKLLVFPNLIHYNGHLFDMTFINTHMSIYNIKCNLYSEIDLFSLIRPIKKILSLSNLKLTTVSDFFNKSLSNDNTISDLTKIYTQYMNDKDISLVYLLFAHHKKDLSNILTLFKNIPLFTFISNIKSMSIPISLTSSQIKADEYHCTFNIEYDGSFILKNNLFMLKLKNSVANMQIQIKHQKLKFFFPHINEYYYLPSEGYAVHKSIGRYISKDDRIPANKTNCYKEKEDYFLPIPKHIILPFHFYKTSYSDEIVYISIEELIKNDGFSLYIKKLIASL